MSYNPNRIQATWSQTIGDLEQTFASWGVTEWSVRPMRELDKRDHSWGEPATVTVKYIRRGETVELSLAKHPYYRQNLRILYLAIEAMRLNEVRGLDEILRDAYLQLAAPRRQRDPWEILGLRPDADEDAIDAVYRAKAKRLHPDAGGSAEAFRELQEAYDAVKGKVPA